MGLTSTLVARCSGLVRSSCICIARTTSYFILYLSWFHLVSLKDQYFQFFQKAKVSFHLPTYTVHTAFEDLGSVLIISGIRTSHTVYTCRGSTSVPLPLLSTGLICNAVIEFPWDISFPSYPSHLLSGNITNFKFHCHSTAASGISSIQNFIANCQNLISYISHDNQATSNNGSTNSSHRV